MPPSPKKRTPRDKRRAYPSHVSGRITRDEAAHVARLARLRFSDEELDELAAQLSAVLDHAVDVEALDVTDIAPTSHPHPLVNVLRADEVLASLERAEVLAQAPSVDDGQFRVPPILGEAP